MNKIGTSKPLLIILSNITQLIEVAGFASDLCVGGKKVGKPGQLFIPSS